MYVCEQKGRVKPVYRRTLSAAELYNLPLPELSHPSSIFTDSHIRTVRHSLPVNNLILLICADIGGLEKARLEKMTATDRDTKFEKSI